MVSPEFSWTKSHTDLDVKPLVLPQFRPGSFQYDLRPAHSQGTSGHDGAKEALSANGQKPFWHGYLANDDKREFGIDLRPLQCS